MTEYKTSKDRSRKNTGAKHIIPLIVVCVILAAAIAGGLFSFFKYRTYSGYTETSSVDIGSSSESVSLYEYKNGCILCAGDGITYFTKDGTVWSESLEITQPIVDICGDYIAVGDMEGSDVYIYSTGGLAGHVTTDYTLLDVEVSAAGVVAMASNSNTSNYIELKDMEGNTLVTAKSIFSSSGYLMDIAISDDASKLAAAFVYTADGALESKVLFYDFSGDEENEDVLVGGFSQYTDTIITNVVYMTGDVVCAIGDNALTFYDISGTPEVISESLELEWQIQQLYAAEDNILIVADDGTGTNSYAGYVYSSLGTLTAEVSLENLYDNAVLSGNSILLYSSSECSLYTTDGQLRFTCSFEENIDCMLPAGSRSKLVYISSGSAHFIKLK